VYYLDPATQMWRAGRTILPRLPDDYTVAFPNQGREDVPTDHLYVRGNSLIGDPTDFLAGRVTESPYLHQRRANLARAFAQQRGASGGMTGLLSAAIALEPHQIEVARRVLQDPVQRYLLADEVGLGKTIEAGTVVRQFVLDDPDGHSVLVAVPAHLVAQWRDELVRRFDLRRVLDESVRVVSFDDLKTALAGPPPRMLVLDEAHQVTAGVVGRPGSPARARFDAVCRAAAGAERLLLLSATPSLHNEAGFQAMLHLLDPAVYPLGDLDAFRVRRAQHQQVAELFHVFHPTESGAFLRDTLDGLTALFPADDRLRALGDELRPFLAYGRDPEDDRRVDLVQEIRCHVSEVYRLHRRLLRNRRTDPRIELVLPGRSGLTIWEYDDTAAKPLAAVLDEWRVAAAGSDRDRGPLADCLRLFWEAAADPLALAALADLRRGEPDADDLDDLALSANRAALAAADLFEHEDHLLVRLAEAARDNENLDRADATVAGIEALWEADPATKMVVFASFPRTADEVYDALRTRWKLAVVRHGDTGWERFRTDPAVGVLVCDRRAEEGLNLQGARVTLVHYDLPLSPNRVEQRLGRVDRYGAVTGGIDDRAVQSVALVARGSAVSQAWCDLLDSAFRVFDRSVAALQYLIEEEVPRVWEDLLLDGADGIRSAAARLGGEAGLVAEALRRIQVLDELDAVEATLDQRDFADRLIAVEELRGTEWQNAFYEWTVERLQFAQWPVPQSAGWAFSYQFRRPWSGSQTLVPVGRLVERFLDTIDRSATARHPIEPITHAMTFARNFARTTGTPLARVGHRFLDAMAEYLRWDDTGVAFGLWRVRPGRPVIDPPADLAFRFDFLIEADVAAAGAGLAVRRLADRLLPPEFVTVWVTGGLELPADQSLVFAEPYRHDRVEPDGYDVNMRPGHWLALEPEFPPGDWDQRVRLARAAADRVVAAHLAASTRLAEHVERARTEAETRRNQLRTRTAFLPAAEAEIERNRAAADEQIWAALVAGIVRPAVRLDALGAVFVSDREPAGDGGGHD
jgi:ATP-dependent helicase HepA